MLIASALAPLIDLNAYEVQHSFPDSPELLILCGLPGAGKSGFAELITHGPWCGYSPKCGSRNHRYYHHVSLDDIRAPYLKYVAWSRDLEQRVVEMARKEVETWLSLRLPVIFEATNLTRSKRAFWVNVAREVGVPARIAWFPIELSEAIRRQHGQTGVGVPTVRVPAARVREMAEQIEVPTADEADEVWGIRLVTRRDRRGYPLWGWECTEMTARLDDRRNEDPQAGRDVSG